MPRNLLSILLAISLTMLPVANAAAQGEAPLKPAKSQQQLIEQRDAKLAKAVFKKVRWLTDYDLARLEAKQSGKPIFIYFTRSDAYCGPCEALEKGALDDSRFVAFGGQVVLLVHVTSGVATDAYQNLLREKNGNAFPSLVWLDSTGTVLAHEEARTAAGFEQTLGKVRDYLAARSQVDSGNAAALPELFTLGVELGNLRADQVRERRRQLRLSTDQQARVERQLISLEVHEILDAARTSAERTAAGKQLVAMKEAGRIPVDETAFTFWSAIMRHADEQRDTDLFAQALAAFEQRFGGDGTARRMIANSRKRLAELRAGK